MMDPSFDGYDWKKMVTRTAAQQNHFISAAGATEKVNYRVGMGYQGEENVFKGNDYERFNFKEQWMPSSPRYSRQVSLPTCQ